METKVNDFLKELTSLCHKHDMWIDGEELRIVDGTMKVLAINLGYDHDTTSLFVDEYAK